MKFKLSIAATSANQLLPFWFWNGEMTEPEICRQIDLAAAPGCLDGLVLHARAGNQIPYLSPRWFALVRCACARARERGLHIWIYDEEGYPSGTAGGKIPAMGEKYQQKLLQVTLMNGREARSTDAIVRIFRKSAPLQPLTRDEISDRDENLIVFTRRVNARSIDMLTREVADAFIATTHEQYFREVGEYFGNTITAVFTDDNHYYLGDGAQLGYTDDLEKSFFREYGYNILDRLGALVENTAESAQIRLDYHRHLARRHAENFIRPMREWCTAYGLEFHGHLSGDEGPFHLMLRNFGDPSFYYRQFAAPGIDDFLGCNQHKRYLHEVRNTLTSGRILNRASGFSMLNLIKQATGIAAEWGDGRCMAEVLAYLGWGVEPEVVRAHLNFLLLNGINIMVIHDYSYATAGNTKRDCPASYFFQQPYFAQTAELWGEVWRSLKLLAAGRPWADTLVLHPIDAVTATVDITELDEPGAGFPEQPAPDISAAQYTDEFYQLELQLLQHHIAFDLGYETTFDQAEVSDGFLRLGKGRYRTVMIPGLGQLSSRQLRLLRQLTEQGGQVITLRRLPFLLDGKRHTETIPGQFIADPATWDFSPLDKALPMQTVPAAAAAEIAVGVRITSDGKLYSLSSFYPQPVEIATNGFPSDVWLYDPAADKVTTLPPVICLDPFRMVHLIPRKLYSGVPETSSARVLVDEVELPASAWTVRRLQPNVGLIDQMAVPSGQYQLFDTTGPGKFPIELPMHTEFQLPETVTDLQLCTEPGPWQRLRLNGREVLDRAPTAHPSSPDWRVYPVGDLIRPGRNLIYAVNRLPRLENFYLLGDFKVQLQGTTSAIIPDSALGFGDLAHAGLPFYWGKISYSTTWNNSGDSAGLNTELRVEAHGVVSCRINGQSLGTQSGSTIGFDLTKVLKRGDNYLELELANTAQNFYGPHRRFMQEEQITVPMLPAESGLPNAFAVASFGILTPPVIRRYRTETR